MDSICAVSICDSLCRIYPLNGKLVSVSHRISAYPVASCCHMQCLMASYSCRISSGQYLASVRRLVSMPYIQWPVSPPYPAASVYAVYPVASISPVPDGQCLCRVSSGQYLPRLRRPVSMPYIQWPVSPQCPTARVSPPPSLSTLFGRLD